MSSLLTAFFAEVALISYRQYAGSGVSGGGIQVPQQAPLNLPLPSAYTAPIIFYGALALVPGQGQHIAGMIGWGIVIATLLNLWDPSGNVKGQPLAAGGDYTRSQLPGFTGPLPSS
jgi:hypothetical protein